MTEIEYQEFVRRCPYDAMGDYSMFRKAPDWWGTSNKDIYDNLIFVMSPITFKLCSSCPYKKEFYRTLKNIQQLSVQLE